jgi:hypothetical protein
MVSAIAIVVFGGGCDHDPGKVFRVPALISTDATLKKIDGNGRINPYAYVFSDQQIVPAKIENGGKDCGRRALGDAERQPVLQISLEGSGAMPVADLVSQPAGSSSSVVKATPHPVAPASGSPVPVAPAFAANQSGAIQGQLDQWFPTPPPGQVPISDLASRLRVLNSLSTDLESKGRVDGMKSLAVLQSTATAYQAALVDKSARNRLQTIMMNQSDQIVARHLSSIIGFEDEVNLLFGVSATSTAAIASIVSPVGTKNILTALSAIFGATRAEIREQVYNNAFGYAIVDRIAAGRKKFKDDVITPHRLQAVDDYPVDAAIAECVEYHNLGSFYEGIIQIGREVAKGDTSSQRPAAALVPITVQPDATTVTLDKDGNGSLDLQISRTTTDAATFTVKSVDITTAPDEKVLKQSSVDAKTKTTVYDIRGAGKVTLKFKAEVAGDGKVSSFDIVITEGKSEIGHKVIQLQAVTSK